MTDSRAGPVSRPSAASKAAVPALTRLGRADEVAEAIDFLLSDEASYPTGPAIPVEGGALAL
ncbi:MAG: Enoyl-(Acyl carrier protein) reductase [Gaiellales bacterium]|jgi:NAD(P)-dependent dehydrogenase (short-subunit alcohol dehydrogenase family)|nr:Enoyl-(Acyl carrier protein) reductase [Gaiellales bacterium]